MPLIGSRGQVIAILQIGFKALFVIDREMAGMLIGYGQKVATALERAFEHEERALLQELDDLAAAVGQQAPSLHPIPEQEINRFLQLLGRRLGVDYIHLRLKDDAVTDDRCYRLITPDNEIGQLHRASRPLLSRTEGSVLHAQSGKSLYTYTADETSRLYLPNTDLVPMFFTVDNDWELAVGKFRTIGNLAITEGQLLRGVLVLHSKQEYFFTGRRQRLISQALGRLQSLLDRQRANFQRTRVEASERALIARGFLGAKTIHDLMGPLGVIQKQVELLSPQADPSSVVAKGLDRIARLTHKIVTLLKDRAKGIDLDYTICGIDIFLSDIFRELESSCDPSIVTLKDVVPDTKVRVNVWLRAAVSSLLENAVESAGGSHGGVCMAIGLDPRQIDRLLIVIENDGPEYSLEQIERMKTPGHSTKGSAHLGLGVPLAEAGIRNAGGDMALKPRHKGGLVAEIVLPIVSYK